MSGLGHEAVVANARRLRLISQSDRKTGRRDAELSARLARADVKLLSPGPAPQGLGAGRSAEGVFASQLVKVVVQLIG